MSDKKINVFKGRKLSLEGAKLIGTGATCRVYTLPDDNVVKVLNSADEKEAEREIQLAKWAFSKGIPTAISYDVVDVDGHPGLVFESLGRGNLRNEFRDKPEQFSEIITRYFDLLKKLNTITVEKGMLPSAKEVFLRKIGTVSQYFSKDEFAKITELIATIPESDHLVHGDFHIKNVKVLNDQLFLIDLDTLSVGDPIFDLMGICLAYKGYPNLNGLGYNDFFEIDNSILVRIYNYVMDNFYDYLSVEDKNENTHKIELMTYIYMIYCLNPDNEDEKDLFNEMLVNVRRDLFEVNDFILKR